MIRETVCGAVSAIIFSMTIQQFDGCDGPIHQRVMVELVMWQGNKVSSLALVLLRPHCSIKRAVR